MGFQRLPTGHRRKVAKVCNFISGLALWESWSRWRSSLKVPRQARRDATSASPKPGPGWSTCSPAWSRWAARRCAASAWRGCHAAPELEGRDVQPAAPVLVEGRGAGGLLTPEMGLDRSKTTGSGHRRAKTAPRRPSNGRPQVRRLRGPISLRSRVAARA